MEKMGYSHPFGAIEIYETPRDMCNLCAQVEPSPDRWNLCADHLRELINEIDCRNTER